MSDQVVFTASASLSKPIIPLLCAFLGMPPCKMVKNPDYVEGGDTAPPEDGEESTFQMEFMEEDWTDLEEKEFIENHVRGLLAEMIVGVVPLGDGHTLTDEIADKQKQFRDATAAREAYLKSAISMTHEDT